MGLFKSTQLFYDVSGYADDVASSLMSTLRYDGYEVDFFLHIPKNSP